jgi:hypothetical protein
MNNVNLTRIIEKALKSAIASSYGDSEATKPCYNLHYLASMVALDIIKEAPELEVSNV